MSGWTIVTMRGKPSSEYEYSDYDDSDPYQAESDIVVTAQNDDRVRSVKKEDHVYAYINMPRYAFTAARDFLDDYSEMVKDAVVLGANDTTDTGTAKYAVNEGGEFRYVDKYEETQNEDEYWVGQKALSYMWVEHNIAAKDPWHNNADLTDYYEENGVDRL